MNLNILEDFRKKTCPKQKVPTAPCKYSRRVVYIYIYFMDPGILKDERNLVVTDSFW